MEKHDDLFLHFLDHEVLDLYGVRERIELSVIRQEAASALKLGYLFTRGTILVPASSYFESEDARSVIDGCGALLASGDLQLVSSARDYDELLDAKREQYKSDPSRYPSYFQSDASAAIVGLQAPLRLREASSTEAIQRGWIASVTRGDEIWETLYNGVGPGGASRFERELHELPSRLGSAAFIWDFAKPLLPTASISVRDEFVLERLISRLYVESYLHEYHASIVTQLRIGTLDCGISRDRQISVEDLRRVLQLAGIRRDIELLNWDDVIRLRYSPSFVLFGILVRQWLANGAVAAVAASVFAHLSTLTAPALAVPGFDRILRVADQVVAQGEALHALYKSATSTTEAVVRKKAFIVHGHDDAAKYELAHHLQKEFNIEAVILHEQPNYGSLTIIEKFERYAAGCDVAIVLLTPDDKLLDMAKPHSTEELLRARQNVIFELGYFIAKFGRERVVVLHKGAVEIPSDVSGVVYIPFDKIENADLKIRRELKAMGLIS